MDTLTPVTPTAAEALLPLICLVTFLFSMLAFYAVRVAIFGRKREAYIEDREHTILAKFFQEWWIWLWTPVERLCLRLRISPDAITIASTAVVAGSAVLMGFNHLSLGGWFFLFGSSFDFIDGRVARATRRGTPHARTTSVRRRAPRAARPRCRRPRSRARLRARDR